MKAILNDGTTVELAKDCGCLTHDGPHWLHVDAIWAERNLKIKADFDKLGEPKDMATYYFAIALAQRFAEQEQARLAGKLRNMQRLGIQEICNPPGK